MSLTAQGAHRGRPVAAAPCTPGLRPAKSPLRGTFDLSLQASGRAEAASMQNTALSPHPCGLPRPSGNVSAILRPPAPAVSAAPCPVAIHILDLDPVGRVRRQPPPGKNTGTMPDILPGGAALARADRQSEPDDRFATVSPRKNGCSVLFPGRWRSRYVFCVMSLLAQGAHRGRPVAAAPFPPALRPATLAG